MSVRHNLKGLRFGKLSVTEKGPDYISPSGKRLTRWFCLCDCGKTCLVNTCNLIGGITKSCGCLWKEQRKKTQFKECKIKNEYYKENDYMVGITKNNNRFLFDIEDYELVKQHSWYLGANGYIVSSDNNILMHRLLLPGVRYIDHINRNKTDNRRKNLRSVTNNQNVMNCSLRKDNTSGVKGVNYEKTMNKWRSRIWINGETIMLGYFDKKEDAVKARKHAEEVYYKEYCYNPGTQMFQEISEEINER